MGYVAREGRTTRYRLTRKWFNLAMLGEVDLIEEAAPWIEKIHQITGESVSLAVLDGDDVLFVHKKTGLGQLPVVNPTGTRLPSHATALGKCILAVWPEERLGEWLEGRMLSPRTPNTITSADELRASLRQVRSAGVATDVEESGLGIMAVAACILDGKGEPLGALCIAVPVHRGRDDIYWQSLQRLVKASAKAITLGLNPSMTERAIERDQLEELYATQTTQVLTGNPSRHRADRS
jgi:DNA-binding IclR family transcriptional regulator